MENGIFILVQEVEFENTIQKNCGYTIDISGHDTMFLLLTIIGFNAVYLYFGIVLI